MLEGHQRHPGEAGEAVGILIVPLTVTVILADQRGVLDHLLQRPLLVAYLIIQVADGARILGHHVLVEADHVAVSQAEVVVTAEHLVVDGQILHQTVVPVVLIQLHAVEVLEVAEVVAGDEVGDLHVHVGHDHLVGVVTGGDGVLQRSSILLEVAAVLGDDVHAQVFLHVESALIDLIVHVVTGLAVFLVNEEVSLVERVGAVDSDELGVVIVLLGYGGLSLGITLGDLTDGGIGVLLGGIAAGGQHGQDHQRGQKESQNLDCD